MVLTRAELLLEAWGRLSWMSLRRVVVGTVRVMTRSVGDGPERPREVSWALVGRATSSALRGWGGRRLGGWDCCWGAVEVGAGGTGGWEGGAGAVSGAVAAAGGLEGAGGSEGGAPPARRPWAAGARGQ
jgi:hypothetical protein